MAYVLFLNTKRTGYAPDQCGETMTVEELIEALKRYDEETPVYFKNDNGYTYGSITSCDIEDAYINEDEGYTNEDENGEANNS